MKGALLFCFLFLACLYATSECKAVVEGGRSLEVSPIQNWLSRDLARSDTATTTIAPETGNEGTDIATSILTIVINVAYIVYYIFVGDFGSVFTTGFNLLETIWKMIFG